MVGTSSNTGQTISESAHIQQSVNDIFSTPLGSRVRLRKYGFDTNVIDQPVNTKNTLKLFIAAANALRWEPRITVSRLQSLRQNGKTILRINHDNGVINAALGN